MKNVILITIDTLRRDMLGCYGAEYGLTPFIDGIAAKSLVFTNMHAVGPYTQASFPGILTSSYYLDHPDYGKGKVLSTERVLVSEVLRTKNVTTAAFHSNPYLCGMFGWNRGWNVFYDSMNDQVTDEVPYIRGNVINRKVASWLSTNPPTPFFLWVHYMDIHEPYVPEKKYIDKVDPSIDMPVAEMMKLFKETLLARDVSDPSKVDTLRKLYMAHVIEVDEYVKELFGIFEEQGILEDSVVILTADHGDEFGEHGGLSHDGKMYSELVNVPFMIYDGGKSFRGTCNKLTSNVDIPPTIAALMEAEPSEKFQGTSILPLDDYDRKECFGEAVGKKGRHKETDRPVYYFTDGRHKVIYAEEGESWEVYDLADDPQEKHNLHGPETKELEERLKHRIGRNK